LGDVFYQIMVETSLAYQMPDCQVASVFHVPAGNRLDKFGSGIPNAILSQPAVAANVAADAVPRLPLPEAPIENAQVVAVVPRAAPRIKQ
jgi:hypothetical protein